MYSSSVGRRALLLHVSCSALSVAHHPALLIGLKPALLLGFSLVVTLRELYGTTLKDASKVLFKGSETPPPTSEDRGLHAERSPHPVSFLTITRGSFPSILMGGY